MPTPYEAIYENLLPKFRSYEIAEMTEDEVKEHLQDYLIPAISRFHMCRTDLTDRDETEFKADLSQTEIEILSNYALLEYIDSTYVRTSTLLKVNLSSSDFNAFSPANHLNAMMNMRDQYLKENETLLARYAWMGVRSGDTSMESGYKKWRKGGGLL